MVTIVDMGTGNLRSLANAMSRIGLESRIARVPEELPGGGWILLPGVGAFGHAADFLNRQGWTEALQRAVAEGGRLLGICLGMQLLYETSEESPGSRGLGLLRGSVKRLDPSRAKVPHIGWAELRSKPNGDRLEYPRWAYFVHSYAVNAADRETVVSWASHGEAFPAAVRQNRVWGVQFHPEKSQEGGLRFLRSLLRREK